MNLLTSSVADLIIIHGMRGQFDGEAEIERGRLERQEARRVLVNSARSIIGGYNNDSPEERAVDMLLRIAQEIPL